MILSPALSTRPGLYTSLAYAALFAGLGAHLPYWPVWLAEWGLDAAEVGRLLGLALIARLISATVFPVLADRLAIRRALMAGMALTAALLIAGHVLIETRAMLIAATLLATLAMSGLIPMGEALGVRASETHGFAYSHARAAGSVAFLATVAALGWLIDRTGPDAALWMIVISFAALAFLALRHPGGGAPPGEIDHARLGEAAALSAKPVFLAFAIAAAVGQASHGVYYVYGTLAWQAQGIPTGTIGLLWAVGVMAEILLLLGPGRTLTERLGPVPLLLIGTGGGIFRWSLTALEPPLWALWPIQALHALSFGAVHLGAMAFIAAAVPRRLTATAQGLVAGGLGGLAMIFATFAAAEISALAGPAAAYWLAVAMSAAAFLAALALRRLWQGERLG